jgi:hypothetical protein
MKAVAASREVAPQNIDASKVGPDRLESPYHAKWRTPDLPYAIDNADADAETSWRRGWRRFAAQRDQFWWQVVAAVIVVAYVGSLLFVSRTPSGHISFRDGGVGTIAGMVPLVPILIRLPTLDDVASSVGNVSGGRRPLQLRESSPFVA